MQIDRREFMSSITSLAILATAKDALAGSSDGVSSKGHLQINTFNLQRGNAFPFVNMFLANDRPWTPANMAGGVDAYAYLDSTGYPTSMPPGGGNYYTLIAVYLPPPGETYTLSWTGAGTLTPYLAVPGFTMTTGGTNPLTITLGIDPTIAAWNSGTSYTQDYSAKASFVSRGGSYYFCNLDNTNKDPLTDNGCYWLKVTTGFQVSLYIALLSTPVAAVKLYRTSLGAPSPTNMFDPQLLSVYGGYGTLRFIQWGQVISSPISLLSNRPKADTFSWWGNTINSDWYVGTPPAPTKNAWIAPRDPPGYVSGGWTDKMQVQANILSGSMPSYHNITAITNANPCQITTSSAHGFSNGDSVFFPENLILSTAPSAPTSYSYARWTSETSAVAFTKGQLIHLTGTAVGIYKATVAMSTGTAPNPATDPGAHWSYLCGGTASISLNGLISGASPKTVTFVDSTNFTIAYDSTTWATYNSGGQVAEQITLSTPSLGAKPVWNCSTSSMNKVFLNAKAGLWIFTYDLELDVFLAQPYASCQYGWPLEAQVALCNKLNCNGWFGIPHMADDKYVTWMATYIRDNLNSNLVAYYELSNEVWNPIWSETGYAGTKAVIYAANGTHGWTGPLPTYTISAYGYYSWFWYGWRFYNAMSLVKTVYAGKLNQCHCTLAHQAAAGTLNRILGPTEPAIIARHLATNCNTAAPPISIADSIATSCYTSPPGGNNGYVPTAISAQMVWQYCYGGLQATALQTLDTLMRSTIDLGSTEDLASYTTYGFPCWGGVANGNTGNGAQVVPWIMYEGGLQFNAVNYSLSASSYSGVSIDYRDLQNLFFGYMQSNYAKDILNASGATNNSLLQAFKANGGTHMSLYAMATQWGVSAIWGPIEPNEWGANTGVSSAPMLLAYKNYNETGNP